MHRNSHFSSCYCTVLLVFFSAGCQLWTARQGVNYANGQWYLAYSLQDCQTGCTMTPGCTGIDWVSTASLGEQCWLSGSWSGAQGNQWDVTHYVYNPSCAGKFQHFDISWFILISLPLVLARTIWFCLCFSYPLLFMAVAVHAPFFSNAILRDHRFF